MTIQWIRPSTNPTSILRMFLHYSPSLLTSPLLPSQEEVYRSMLKSQTTQGVQSLRHKVIITLLTGACRPLDSDESPISSSCSFLFFSRPPAQPEVFDIHLFPNDLEPRDDTLSPKGMVVWALNTIQTTLCNVQTHDLWARRTLTWVVLASQRTDDSRD